MKKDIRGVVVPIITPLKEDGATVDEKGMERLIDYVVEGGVNSLFVLGTTGEGPCLSSRAKQDVMVYTNRYLNGRVKNLTGITDTSADESIRWSRIAADNGADAVVLAPPPYFTLSPDELVGYTRHIVRHSPLPVILYNIPRLTKTAFTTEALQYLADEKGIIGFKDSSRDWDYFKDILPLAGYRPDWTILTGAEELLVRSMAAGADGGVLGGANLFPAVWSDFYKAVRDKNTGEAERLEELLSRFRNIYTLGKGATSSIQVIKYVLERKKICLRTMVRPFNDLDDERGGEAVDIIRS